MGKKNRNKGGGRRGDRYDDIYGDFGSADYDDYQEDEDYQYSYRDEVDSAEFVDIDEETDGNADDEWDETEDDSAQQKTVAGTKRQESPVASKDSSVKKADSFSDSPKTKSTASEEREAWAMIHEKNSEIQKADAKAGENAEGGKESFVKKMLQASTEAVKQATRWAAGLFKRKSEKTLKETEGSIGQDETASGETAKKKGAAENESAKAGGKKEEKKKETSEAEREAGTSETADVAESKGKKLARKIAAVGGRVVEMGKSLLFRLKKASDAGNATAETEENVETPSNSEAVSTPQAQTSRNGKAEKKAEKAKGTEKLEKTEKAEKTERSDGGVPGIPDKTPEEERREKRRTYLILGISTVSVALLLLIAGVIYLTFGHGDGLKTAQKMDDPSSESLGEGEKDSASRSNGSPEDMENLDSDGAGLSSSSKSRTNSGAENQEPSVDRKTSTTLDLATPNASQDALGDLSGELSDDALGLDVLNSSDLSGTTASGKGKDGKKGRNGKGGKTGKTGEKGSKLSSGVENGAEENALGTLLPEIAESDSNASGTLGDSSNPLNSGKKSSVPNGDSLDATGIGSGLSSDASTDITVGEMLDNAQETGSGSFVGRESERAADGAEKNTEDPFASLDGSVGDFSGDAAPAGLADRKNPESEKSGEALNLSGIPDDANENSVSSGPVLPTIGEREPAPESLLTPDGVSSGSNVREWDQSTEDDPISPAVSDMAPLSSMGKNETSTAALNGDSAGGNGLPSSGNSFQNPASSLESASVSDPASELGIDLNDKQELPNSPPQATLSEDLANGDSASEAEVAETLNADSAFSVKETTDQSGTDSLLEPPALGVASLEQKEDSENPLAGLADSSPEISADSSPDSASDSSLDSAPEILNGNDSSGTEADPLSGLGLADIDSGGSDVLSGSQTSESAGRTTDEFQTSGADFQASGATSPGAGPTSGLSSGLASQEAEMVLEGSSKSSPTTDRKNQVDDLESLGGLDGMGGMTNLPDLQTTQNPQFNLNSRSNVKKTNGGKERDGARISNYSSYVVLAGDTYWKISEKFYGTPAYKEALARYNSDVVPDSNDLKAGMSLQIPDLEFLRSCFPTLCPQSAQVVYVPSSTSGESRPIQFYVVEKGDTLSELAEQLLGDASRWPEIYRLNSEKILDLDILPVGEKLQIPVENTDSSSRFWK